MIKQSNRSVPKSGLDAVVDRTPPHDLQAEKAVIGAMILDPRCVDEVAVRLNASDFYSKPHGELFDALCLLKQMNLPIDDTSVLLPKLKSYGLIGPAGISLDEIANCVNSSISSSVMFYVEQIINHSRHRALISLAMRAIADLQSTSPDLDAVGELLVSRVTSIESRTAIELTTMRQAADKFVEHARKNMSTGVGSGVPTGFQSLDAVIGGMCAGELLILAARPGQGKSAMATQIATQVADADGSVLFVTLEMTDQELVGRVLCALSGVSGRVIRNGLIRKEEVDKLDKFAKTLNQPVRYYFPATASLRHIHAATRVASVHGPLRLVIVDYLQRVDVPDARMPKHEQLGLVTKGLKRIAHDFNVPMLALCQLNRDSDGNAPKLRDLKGSADIEQDADVVLAIHTPQGKTDVKELLVLKNRHGDVTNLTFKWLPAATKFEEQEVF